MAMLPLLIAATLASAAEADVRSLRNWSLMELEIVRVDVAARSLTVRHALMAPGPWTLQVGAAAVAKLGSLVRGERIRVLCRIDADEAMAKGSTPRCAEVVAMTRPPRWPDGPFQYRVRVPIRVTVQILEVGPRQRTLRVRAVRMGRRAPPADEWHVALQSWARDDVLTVRPGDRVRLTCATEDRLRGQPPNVACRHANAIGRIDPGR